MLDTLSIKPIQFRTYPFKRRRVDENKQKKLFEQTMMKRIRENKVKCSNAFDEKAEGELG